MSYEYNWPMPAITVDVIAYNNKLEQVVIIKRLASPHEDKFAIPGGFMEIDEKIEDAAVREFAEECGVKIKANKLKFLTHADAVHRDTRGRVVSVVFSIQLSEVQMQKLKAGDDAKSVARLNFGDLKVLTGEDFAFDHKQILELFTEKVLKI